ncbi:MAG: TIR domain-containing protein [Coprobacillaceae bacterium]
MKVFLSWSGEKSQRIALIFKEWLPSVIQSIEPYVSSEDIDKGTRWSSDIAKELENSSFGIVCVTKENIEAPWLSFEAGALSKTINKSFVSPFLFDIKRSEVHGPILQFQSTIFQKEDIKRLMNTMNKACGKSSISEKRFNKAFDVWYPTLESELHKLDTDTSYPKMKKTSTNIHAEEVLEEILDLSRDNLKLIRTVDDTAHDYLPQALFQIESLNKQIEMYTKRLPKPIETPNLYIEKIYEILDEDITIDLKLHLVSSLFNTTLPWITSYLENIINDIKNKNITVKEVKDKIQEIDQVMQYFFITPKYTSTTFSSKTVLFKLFDIIIDFANHELTVKKKDKLTT